MVSTESVTLMSFALFIEYK